jgi:hypothetical protein
MNSRLKADLEVSVLTDMLSKNVESSGNLVC